MDYEQIGIITVKDGNVHLDTSFNACASCCEDDETGTILQREDYVLSGWNEPKTNPRLASAFWDVWNEWNGNMCGGIYLDDNNTYEKTDAVLDQLQKVTPSEIATLADGTYAVVAEFPTK